MRRLSPASGHMYASGVVTGLPDYASALSWLRKSQAKPAALGLYGLGYLHFTGKGVGKADAEKVQACGCHP